jgi:hypothetical protein
VPALFAIACGYEIRATHKSKKVDLQLLDLTKNQTTARADWDHKDLCLKQGVKCVCGSEKK